MKWIWFCSYDPYGYTARIAIALLYRALLTEEITWAKLHELGNCINEFFRQNALFFSSWGLNTVTNSFTNIRQLDPRWPVIVSAQKYLFVAKKFSWHWEQLILPTNLKNLLVGGWTMSFFFPFWENKLQFGKAKWRMLRLVVKTCQWHPSTSKAGPRLTKPSKMLLHGTASRLPPNALERHQAGASLQGEPLDPLHQSFYTQGIWQTLIYSKGWKFFSYLCPRQISNHTTKGSGNFWFYRNTDLDTKMPHPSKNNTIIYYPRKTFSEKQGESGWRKSKMLSCFSLLWLPRPEPWLTITLTPLWEPASELVRLSGRCVLHTCLSVKPAHFWPRGEVSFPCSKIMF